MVFWILYWTALSLGWFAWQGACLVISGQSQLTAFPIYCILHCHSGFNAFSLLMFTFDLVFGFVYFYPGLFICICTYICICIGVGILRAVTLCDWRSGRGVPNQAVGPNQAWAFPRYCSHTNAAPIQPNQSRASCTTFHFFNKQEMERKKALLGTWFSVETLEYKDICFVRGWTVSI